MSNALRSVLATSSRWTQMIVLAAGDEAFERKVPEAGGGVEVAL
jgi:hypothetical protein